MESNPNVLARLRFEQAMGLETVARVALTARAVPPSEAPQMPARADQTPAAPAGETPAPISSPAGSDASPTIGGNAPTMDADRWNALEARAMACTSCFLHKGRTKVVFGTGSRTAQLVFVGEAPGADEDAQGLPFVGRSGQLLTKIIAAMGLRREDVYICNTVKCRPPENRTPLPDEIGACNPFLVEQLELIGPKAIVALGAPAAKTLLRTTTGIGALRGKWHSYRNIPVMPTYHPAFLLRAYTEENRRAVWDDMKKVMERLKA